MEVVDTRGGDERVNSRQLKRYNMRKIRNTEGVSYNTGQEANSGHFIFVRLFIVVTNPCTSCTLVLFDLRINHFIASLN